MQPCNSIRLDAQPKHSDDIISRMIVDELILVPIRKTAGKVDSIYTLNEVATFVWEALDSRNTVNEICQKVEQEFQVDLETATADVIELLVQLNEIGAVKGF